MSLEAIAFALVALAVVGGAIFWSVRSSRSERDPRPPYIRALGALVDGDHEAAFAEFKNAVRLDSGNVDAYLRLGDLFRERGDTDRAYQIHRELAARSRLPAPMKARILHSLCHDLAAMGRLEKATESAAESARLAEDPVPALNTQIEILTRRDDVEGAFRVRKELLKRQGLAKTGNPELAVFRAGQGRALLEAGSLEHAEKVLKDARKLDPANIDATYLWGLLKEKQGKYPGAIEAWEGILRDHPQSVVGLFRSLERVRFLDGSFGEMESTYGRFLETVPGHEGASFGLASFLSRKGHLDEGLDVCRNGCDANPGSDALRVLHLELLLQAGRPGEAESLLQTWLSEILGESGADSSGEVAPDGPSNRLEPAS